MYRILSEHGMYIRHWQKGTDSLSADAAPHDDLLVTDESILSIEYLYAPIGRSQGGPVGAHPRPYSVGRKADPYGARHLPCSEGRTAGPQGLGTFGDFGLDIRRNATTFVEEDHRL